MIGNSMSATECPPLTVKDEMQIVFLRLGFSQTVAQMLMGDQRIDTLASLFDEDISTICDVIRRHGRLVSREMPDRRESDFGTGGKEESQAHCIHVQDNGTLLQAL